MHVHPCIIECACSVLRFLWSCAVLCSSFVLCAFLETTEGCDRVWSSGGAETKPGWALQKKEGKGGVDGIWAEKYLIEHFLHYLGRRRQAGVWMAGTDEEAIVMQMVEPGRPSGRSGSPLIFIAPSFLSTYRLACYIKSFVMNQDMMTLYLRILDRLLLL